MAEHTRYVSVAEQNDVNYINDKRQIGFALWKTQAEHNAASGLTDKESSINAHVKSKLAKGSPGNSHVRIEPAGS